MSKKINKILSLLLCILLTVALSACGTNTDGDKSAVSDGGSIEGYGNNFTAVSRDVMTFDTDSNGDFTILQFSDTHLFSSEKKKDKKTIDGVKNAISSVKPELAVVLGDMIDGKNDKSYYNKENAIRGIAQVFEDANCYWAYVPGNNDGEYLGTNNDVLALLSEYPHCLFSAAANAGGSVEYVIDIKSGGNTVHSLVFMDSGSKHNGKYDAFDDKEVQWLKNTLLSRSGNKCSLFYHMNTDAFTIAGEQGTPYNQNYKAVEQKIEKIKGNNSVDDVAKSSGNVGLFSIGHLHPKHNECSFYDGAYYHITQPSGYDKSDNPCASLVTIHTLAGDVKSMYDFKSIEFEKD